MKNGNAIMDIHIHIFNQINGRKSDGLTSSLNYGKVKTEKGEMQFMPPYAKETSFTAEVILEMMDFAGISKAVLVQNPLIGIVNDTVADAIKRYPDRFIGTIQVDPLVPNAVEIIKKYSSNPKHNIIKFEISDGWGWCSIHKNLKLDDECFTPIWELALEKKLQIILDPGRPNNTGYQVESIDRITTEYSNITFIIEHLGGMNKENILLKKRWYEMIKLDKKKNVYMGIASIGAGFREDFPCFQALELLKESVEIIGAEKILWGSDIPGTLKYYTYRQMADIILTYANFLNEKEKEMIMGKNALRIFTGF